MGHRRGAYGPVCGDGEIWGAPRQRRFGSERGISAPRGPKGRVFLHRRPLTQGDSRATLDAMNTRTRLHPLTFAGLIFLVLGSLSLRYKPHTAGGRDLGDAVSGLLYGLAIGCMLLGILKNRRRPDRTGPPQA
jgi:hypothetical protein